MLALGSRRTTHFARFALCVQTGAASQFTKRASHADPRPGLAGRAGPAGPAVRKAQAVRWTACVRAHLLVATEIAPAGHRPPRGNACGSCREQRPRPSKGAFGQDGARLWGAEKRRARGLARSASCPLTRRGCPNAANAVSEVSSATGPRGRASQGRRRAAPTAPVKRHGLPGRAFAAPVVSCIVGVQRLQWAESRPQRKLRMNAFPLTPRSSRSSSLSAPTWRA